MRSRGKGKYHGRDAYPSEWDAVNDDMEIIW
jgi:hypothetical protein